MSILSKKICLLGDFSVGKTSLTRRFIEGMFSDKYLTTVGIKISRKNINIRETSQQINLLVWDVEGNTKYKKIQPNYLQGASGAIIVGDLTRNNTLDNIPSHLELFWKFNPNAKVLVAFNKSDLITKEKLDVKVSLYTDLIDGRVINTYITSAKTGDRVNTMFEELANSLVNN